MYLGLNSLGLRSTGSSFSPSALFAAGEQGGWYDASDMSTMYQDATGLTPVTAVGQPVGFWLDKRKGSPFGSELATSAANPGSWTTNESSLASAGAGVLQLTTAGAGSFNTSASINITTVVGQIYRITGTLYKGTCTNTIRIDFGGTTVGTNTSSSPANVALNFTATGVSTSLVIAVAGNESGTTAFFSNLSVKVWNGNHLSQATTTSRPILKALYNKLIKTDQLTDAAWSATACSMSADGTLTEDTTTSQHNVRNAATVGTAGVSYTFSADITPLGRTWAYLAAYDGTTTRQVWFNLSNGTVGTTSGATGSISSLGGGAYRCIMVVTSAASFAAQVGPATADNITSYLGTGIAALKTGRLDVRTTADAALTIPAYQRVDTTSSYDTAGFPMYLEFDGVDDNLKTAANMDLSGTQKVTVFFGATNYTSSTSVPYELTAITNSTAGGLDGVFQSTGAFDASQNPTGTNLTGASSPGVAVPHNSVYSVQHDMTTLVASAAIIERRNGAAYSAGGTNVSAANFANAPFFVGARNGTSNPWNGRAYQLVVRGAVSASTDISNAEKYVGNKMGITL